MEWYATLPQSVFKMQPVKMEIAQDLISCVLVSVVMVYWLLMNNVMMVQTNKPTLIIIRQLDQW